MTEAPFQSLEWHESRCNVDDLWQAAKIRLYQSLKKQVTTDMRLQLAELKHKHREIKDLLSKATDESTPPDEVVCAQACTIAIYEALIEQIAYWREGEYCESFVAMSKCMLYPIVYAGVMQGVDGYYLTHLDQKTADDITFLGRQFCKELMEMHTSTRHGKVHLREWWAEIALPCLYGGDVAPDWMNAPTWDEDDFNRFQGVANELDRILYYPEQDKAIKLLDSHRDFIRMFSGVPEYTARSMTTRL